MNAYFCVCSLYVSTPYGWFQWNFPRMVVKQPLPWNTCFKCTEENCPAPTISIVRYSWCSWEHLNKLKVLIYCICDRAIDGRMGEIKLFLYESSAVFQNQAKSDVFSGHVCFSVRRTSNRYGKRENIFIPNEKWNETIFLGLCWINDEEERRSKHHSSSPQFLTILDGLRPQTCSSRTAKEKEWQWPVKKNSNKPIWYMWRRRRTSTTVLLR